MPIPPDLRLTCQQACQIWGLGDARCQELFDALVLAGFLTRGADGAYGGVAELERHGCS